VVGTWCLVKALRERSPRRRMFCEVLLVITYVVSAIVSDCREYWNLVYFDGLWLLRYSDWVFGYYWVLCMKTSNLNSFKQCCFQEFQLCGHPYMLSYTSQEQYALSKVYSCIVPFTTSSCTESFPSIFFTYANGPEHTKLIIATKRQW